MLKVDPSRITAQDQIQEKRERLLTIMVDLIKQVSETDAGYQLRFSPDIEDLILVCDWIQVERSCSPFLRFSLHVASNNGPISCELEGPEGTKSFLHSTLGLNRWL